MSFGCRTFGATSVEAPPYGRVRYLRRARELLRLAAECRSEEAQAQLQLLAQMYCTLAKAPLSLWPRTDAPPPTMLSE